MASPLPEWAHWYRRGYEALHYRMRTFAGGQYASHCRPVSIAILLTNRCNAKCVHCDIWKNRGQEESPSVDQWKRVSSDLRRWLGPVHVVFTGGEALLRPWAPEVAAYASRLGLFVEFLTHGYWEDQTRMEQLARANPSRVTLSLDGIGETHSKVRGKAGFFEKTHKSIETLLRLRREERLQYMLRFKTVVMSHNFANVHEIAEYAGKQEGTEVFYQPIEQNYNTPEDPRWFETSANWPRDTEAVEAEVRRLIELKHQGLPIANSFEQLEAMIPYFRDPDSSRVRVQDHSAHETRPACSALITIQINEDGAVQTCTSMPAVGNIKEKPIREIWETRPAWWKGGCCIDQRASEREKERWQLVNLS